MFHGSVGVFLDNWIFFWGSDGLTADASDGSQFPVGIKM